MADYDAVVVGSGDQRPACAALLARGGWGVCVLERNDWFGGAIQTAEITEPGYLHDVFSAWHPLWVGGAAHAQLGEELAPRGLEYLNTELPDGDAVPRRRERVPAAHAEANAAELGRRSGRAVLESVLPERRPRVRRARHRALVAARAPRSR